MNDCKSFAAGKTAHHPKNQQTSATKTYQNLHSKNAKTPEKSGVLLFVPYGLDLSNFIDDFQSIRTLMNHLPRTP